MESVRGTVAGLDVHKKTAISINANGASTPGAQARTDSRWLRQTHGAGTLVMKYPLSCLGFESGQKDFAREPGASR